MGRCIISDIPDQDILTICDLLNGFVADFLILGSHVKQAHWQARGANFLSIHNLLDVIYTHIQISQDQMAERIQQLGGDAVGCAHDAVKRSTLIPIGQVPYSADLLKIIDSDVHAASNRLRQGILAIEPLKDPVTVDICTEILRGLDTYWWQLNASRE